jgi:hypothetical protein
VVDLVCGAFAFLATDLTLEMVTLEHDPTDPRPNRRVAKRALSHQKPPNFLEQYKKRRQGFQKAGVQSLMAHGKTRCNLAVLPAPDGDSAGTASKDSGERVTNATSAVSYCVWGRLHSRR